MIDASSSERRSWLLAERAETTLTAHASFGGKVCHALVVNPLGPIIYNYAHVHAEMIQRSQVINSVWNGVLLGRLSGDFCGCA